MEVFWAIDVRRLECINMEQHTQNEHMGTEDKSGIENNLQNAELVTAEGVSKGPAFQET